MKKKLFLGLLAAAAVSFTACQKDEVLNEVQQDNAIGFGTYVGRDAQTKASVTDKTAMEKNTYAGFGVFAYYTGSKVFSDFISEDTNTGTVEKDYHTPNFMTNINVTWSTDKWYYENTKYWPNATDKISFFAYAPYKASPELGTDNFGYPTVSFTVAGTVAEQVDLLYASAIDKFKGDQTSGAFGSDGGVKLAFNHALSRVGFKVKTAREDYKVQVTSITLKGNFNTSGTCTLKDGSFISVTPTSNREYTFGDFNDYISSTAGVIITPAPDGPYLMTIPQDFRTDGITVSVTYKYQYKYGSGENDYASETTNTQNGTVKLNLEKGNAYTLVMTLDPLNPIVFSLESSVADWGDPTDHTAIPTQGV